MKNRAIQNCDVAVWCGFIVHQRGTDAMMEKWYKVFISSTKDDLSSERQAVVETLLKINCIPIGMEFFPSTGEHQWDIIKRDIAACDYYLLIIAGKYGTINKLGIGGDQFLNLSYTEMEYRYALSLHKPIIAFIRKNIDSLPTKKAEDSSMGRKKLNAFRTSVQDIVEVQFWKNKNDLCANVSTSLHKAFMYYPQSGLIPATTSEIHVQSLMSEIDTLQAQCSDYLSQVKRLRRENAILLDETEELYRFAKCIYVYTKDNQRITLPDNATALDFAFYIHKMVGLCAKKIYVTSLGGKKPRPVSFGYSLRAGDTINVISDSGKNGAPPIVYATSSWMKHLRTHKAQKALNSAIRNGLIM